MKQKFNLFCYTAILLLMCSIIYSLPLGATAGQSNIERTVQGRVIDENNDPLIGVTITLKSLQRS